MVLAPAVVVSAAPVAEAATITATAATVGARAAAPAAAATCASGGPVTWAICGVAVLAIGAGIAYVTRDTWMPWLGGSLGTKSVADPARGVAFTVSWADSPQLDPATNRWWAKLTAYGQGSPGDRIDSVFFLLNVVCKDNVQDIYSRVQYSSNHGQMFFNGEAKVGPRIEMCSVQSHPVSIYVTGNGPGVWWEKNTLSWLGQDGVTRAPEGASEAERARASENADRMNFRTELQCKNGAAVQTVTVTSTRAPIMPSCTDRLGAGWAPTRSDTWGGFDLPGIKAEPPATITYNRDTLYPDCAVSSCELAVSYRGTPCLEGATGCTNWTTGVLANPADYACRYGPYTLSVDACAPIERLYEPGGRILPATGPNTDGKPDTQTSPQTQPATGTPPAPVTTTNPGTGTGTGGTTFPTTAPNPGPGAPGTGPGGGVVEDQAAECWPDGWGWFNPAQWVLRPLRCAFIPSPATAARVSDIGTDLQTRPPYTTVVEANSALSAMSGIDTQCFVYDFSFTMARAGEIDVTVFDTCTPGAIEGIVMQYRGLLSAVIWVSILAPLAWWAWREYAPGSKGVA